jgi:hypothetical protein
MLRYLLSWSAILMPRELGLVERRGGYPIGSSMEVGGWVK